MCGAAKDAKAMAAKAKAAKKDIEQTKKDADEVKKGVDKVQEALKKKEPEKGEDDGKAVEVDNAKENDEGDNKEVSVA